VKDMNFDASIYAVFFGLVSLSLFCTHTLNGCVLNTHKAQKVKL